MTDQIDFDLADVLAQSRELIQQEGWCKGEFRLIDNEWDETGEEVIDWSVVGYCAMGGALYSLGIDEQECATDPRTLAVAEALVKAAGLGLHDASTCTKEGVCTCTISWVTSWNDHETTTREEVLDAFMKAEKDARSGNVDE